MRRLITILLLAAMYIGLMPAVSAQEKRIDYEKFFIDKENATDYENYLVGKTIVFYEPETKGEKLFKLDGIEMGVPYVVKSLSSYYSLAIRHLDIVVARQDVKGDKGLHIKCRKGESTDKKPGFDDFPAFFYEPIVTMEAVFVGKTITENNKQFTITDIFVNKSDETVSFVFTADDGERFLEPVNDALDYMYVDTLISVEKPQNDAIQPGTITPVKEGTYGSFLYEDNVIRILISHHDYQFNFSIQNLTDGTIKLIWDDAAYVNELGSTSKVIHNGIKYNERENPQTPSLIVKGTNYSDLAVPINNIIPDEKFGWRVMPVYVLEETGNIALLLPIQIKGTNNEYIFVFERTVVRRHPELH